MEKTNENLPMVVNKNKLATVSKFKRMGKILGYSAAGTGMFILTAGISMVSPILSALAGIGTLYTYTKAATNVIYKTNEDLAFITHKKRGNIVIEQDATRIDVINKLRGLTRIEKAGFMQLQAIVGISKFNNEPNRENSTYQTLTHGINMKTFKTLRELGYISDYEETYKKQRSLMIEKLLFGNLNDLNEKTDFYDIKFKLTDKIIDINDEKLRRCFPIIFGKRGILATKPWAVVQNPDGTLSIDYKSKDKIINRSSGRKKLQKSLQKDVPTHAEQKEQAINFIDETSIGGNEIIEEKDRE